MTSSMCGSKNSRDRFMIMLWKRTAANVFASHFALKRIGIGIFHHWKYAEREWMRLLALSEACVSEKFGFLGYGGLSSC